MLMKGRKYQHDCVTRRPRKHICWMKMLSENLELRATPSITLCCWNQKSAALLAAAPGHGNDSISGDNYIRPCGVWVKARLTSHISSLSRREKVRALGFRPDVKSVRNWFLINLRLERERRVSLSLSTKWASVCLHLHAPVKAKNRSDVRTVPGF